MHDKETRFKIIEYEILNDDSLIKTASAGTLIGGEMYDPEFLYIRVRAVSAGEYWGSNKNADYFEEDELKRHYKTFLQANMFKNHENKDVANAIGAVLEALWIDEMKYVELLLKIDRKIAPNVVRGFEKGYMTDVSMGCKVKYTVCSICGNVARTRKDFCEHISNPRLRNTIMADGKRVFEINRDFRFHDISAVLTGAEKPAKIMERVAGEACDSYMEKAASLDLASSIINTSSDDIELMANQASEWIGVTDPEDVGDDHFLSKMASASGKEKFLQKIAEVKKRLTGKIIGVGGTEFISEKMVNHKAASDLIKLLYTDYWDSEKCEAIAMNLRELANDQEIAYEIAFEKFLSMTSLMGIEISPLEYDRIQTSLCGGDLGPERQASKEKMIEAMLSGTLNNNLGDCSEFMPLMDKMTMDNMPDADIPVSSFRRIGTLPDGDMSLLAGSMAGIPVGRALNTIAITIKGGQPEEEQVSGNSLADQIFNLLKGEMPARSVYPGFSRPRTIRILKQGQEPNLEGLKHFILSHVLNMTSNNSHSGAIKMALGSSGIGHAMNRMRIIKQAESGELDAFMDKHASYLESGKESLNEAMNNEFAERTAGLGPKFIENGLLNPSAYTKRRRMIFGVPGAYIYSGIQAARKRRGERLSGFNEFAADNPAGLAAGNLIFGNLAFKGIAHAGNGARMLTETANSKYGEKARELFGKDKEFEHKADDYSFVFSKLASEVFENADKSLGLSMDLFNNEDVERKLIEIKKYSREQISWLKQASVLMDMGREDVADDILKKLALEESDLNNFIKVAKETVKEELEKVSTFGIGEFFAQDAMMRKPKEMITSAPGMLLDAAIVAGVMKKLSPTKDKMKERAVTYGKRASESMIKKPATMTGERELNQ